MSTLVQLFSLIFQYCDGTALRKAGFFGVTLEEPGELILGPNLKYKEEFRTYPFIPCSRTLVFRLWLLTLKQILPKDIAFKIERCLQTVVAVTS